MEFCNLNCGFFTRFYTYTLAKYYGIGKGSLSYKDRLFAYLNMNSHFLDVAVGDVEQNTEFIGAVVPLTTVLPTITPDRFYDNDQDAYDNGVQKNDIYYLSDTNTYGLPYGTPKKLVEDVT